MAINIEAEKRHRSVLRDLVEGLEAPADAAHAAIRWLRADVTVVATANGGVRLRVPVMPRSATDVRGSR
jgi:hypothetical protein